jgi:NtrC-family two-component system response regulator AlgB
MHVLVIDDDKTFRDATCFLIEGEGHDVQGTASGQQAMTLLEADRFDALLLDLNLGIENGLDVLAQLQTLYPHLPVVMFTAESTLKLAVEAMRRGAADFLAKPFCREQIVAVLERLQNFEPSSRHVQPLEQEDIPESNSDAVEPVVDFATPVMRDAMNVLLRAAPTPASILLLGESGTGKTVAAQAVHQHSHISDRPMVTVSCPSLSKELLESDLFGHVKGSFTGAIKDHWGKVKAADGGTLFLDEIGDLPVELQPKLLRLLQEREYERLGENVTRQATVRVIAATNRDLKKSVNEGSFREDLYFRLNVITVELPPLRVRSEDTLLFAERYAQHFATQCGRKITGFTPAATDVLRTYSWPGNLREMRNAIERAVILAKSNEIVAADLPAEIQPEYTTNKAETTDDGMLTLEKLEELHIRRVLERSPNLCAAAEILGIDQTTLYRKRRKLGI